MILSNNENLDKLKRTILYIAEKEFFPNKDEFF